VQGRRGCPRSRQRHWTQEARGRAQSRCFAWSRCAAGRPCLHGRRGRCRCGLATADDTIKRERKGQDHSAADLGEQECRRRGDRQRSGRARFLLELFTIADHAVRAAADDRFRATLCQKNLQQHEDQRSVFRRKLSHELLTRGRRLPALGRGEPSANDHHTAGQHEQG
jgi:hypothetical protein